MRLNKVLRWLKRYLLFFTVLLIIIVVMALIDVYGTDISSNSVNVIVAVAAGASTFFLYLAFKESKKSNLIRIYEPEFSYLEQQVSAQEIKSHEALFLTNANHISVALNYPLKSIKGITYKSFLIDLSKLISVIRSNSMYINCISLLDGKEKVQLPNNVFIISDAKKISSIVDIVQHSFVTLNNNFMNHYYLYRSIDNSQVITEQKVILLNRMNIISKEYFTLTDQFLNKVGLAESLSGFQIFEFTMKKELKKHDNNFNVSILSIVSAIEEITSKYDW